MCMFCSSHPNPNRLENATACVGVVAWLVAGRQQYSENFAQLLYDRDPVTTWCKTTQSDLQDHYTSGLCPDRRVRSGIHSRLSRILRESRKGWQV